MQRICFTHTSSEVYPNVLLMNFFKMVGIYAHQRFFDFDEEKEKELLEVIANERKKIDVDMYLYYVSDIEGVRYFKNHFKEKKSLIFCSSEFTNELRSILDTEIITIGNEADFNEITKNMINEMYKKTLISLEEKDDLLFCLESYYTNEIWKLSFYTDNFPNVDREEVKESIKSKYKDVSISFYNKIFERFGQYGTDNFPHAQYMFLYLGYEGNKYCKNSGKDSIFTTRSLLSMCEKLANKPKFSNYSEMFHILLGQMHQDIYFDFNLALELYSKYREFNDYSRHLMGKIYQEHCKDYSGRENAIEQYNAGILINPENYRSWFNLGTVYSEQDEYTQAYNCYNNVIKILQPRMDKGVINFMEALCIYKSEILIAIYWNKVKGILASSVNHNQNALKIGELFKNSNFFEKILDNNTYWWEKFIIYVYNPKKICIEIAKLADKLEDTHLEQQMYEKTKPLIEQQKAFIKTWH